MSPSQIMIIFHS